MSSAPDAPSPAEPVAVGGVAGMAERMDDRS